MNTQSQKTLRVRFLNPIPILGKDSQNLVASRAERAVISDPS